MWCSRRSVVHSSSGSCSSGNSGSCSSRSGRVLVVGVMELVVV